MAFFFFWVTSFANDHQFLHFVVYSSALNPFCFFHSCDLVDATTASWLEGPVFSTELLFPSCQRGVSPGRLSCCCGGMLGGVKHWGFSFVALSYLYLYLYLENSLSKSLAYEWSTTTTFPYSVE